MAFPLFNGQLLYQKGSGLYNPDHTRFVLTIPKNASTYIANWTLGNGWNIGNLVDEINNAPFNEIIVILRDPVARWISGISQYLNSYILHPAGPNSPILLNEATVHNQYVTAEKFISWYNPIVERLLFDVIDQFDDHVYPQHFYFAGFENTAPIKFFYMDQTFDSELSSYLRLAPDHTVDKNKGSDSQDIAMLESFFRDRLLIRPELLHRLKKNYKIDYDIIDKHFGARGRRSMR